MFTPQNQRKRRAPWTPPMSSGAPRTEANATALVDGRPRLSAVAKGKAVAFVDGPSQSPPSTQPHPAALQQPPPLNSLAENVVTPGYDDGTMKDWKRFKEAGLLDEASMEKKDREALVQTVSRLEKELYDYQHNMGILLLQNDNLSSRCEELELNVAEAREILKREQNAHLIAMSEAEKREENLKRALDLEKKCVMDLESSLHDLHQELEQIKVSSETTMTNTKARVTQIENDRLEVEGKLYSAKAKMAEADRKLTELDIKLQEVKDRESTLNMQRQTLETERAAHESTMRKQKEDLIAWERKLQEREERMCENRRNLDEKEEKLHKSERSYMEKEKNLEQLQRKFDLANDTLKQLEDGINRRLADLVSREEKAEALRINLETRDKQLHAMEERLSAKEKVEIQKLLDEHQAVFSTKMQELELEMEHRRNTLDEEFKNKMEAFEKKEAEINHQATKLAKQEQALEKKSERTKEKVKDIEEQSKALKVREKSIKSEESKLDVAKKNLSDEKESLVNLRDEIQKLREDLRKEELEVEEQNEKLKISEEKYAEYVRLQSSLKLEMEKWRQQNELLTKQIEDLRQDKVILEKDWEALDEKKTILEKDLKKIQEEKENFERFRVLEGEKLKQEKAEMEAYIEQELEAIKLGKESFGAQMKHEQLMLVENTQNQHDQMVQDFEKRRRELEKDARKRQDELEKSMLDKEMAFEETKLKELNNINHLKELAEMQLTEVEFGRQEVDKEIQVITSNKKQLEEDRLEIQKDIDALSTLSKKLKGQREQLLGERARFLDLINKLANCKSCGDFTRKFVLSDLHLPPVDEMETLPSPLLSDRSLKNTDPTAHADLYDAVNLGTSGSGGNKSWIRKCASRIFKLSPVRSIERSSSSLKELSGSTLQLVEDQKNGSQNLPVTAKEWRLGAHGSANQKVETSVRIPNPSNVQLFEFSDKAIQEAASEGPSINVSRNVDHEEVEVPEESAQSSRRRGRKLGRKSTATGVRRTRSVKAVVEDAKLFLGTASATTQEMNEDKDVPESSLQVEEPASGSVTTARKRGQAKSSTISESEQQKAESSDERADSVNTGGRKKRRQTVNLTLSAPGEKRYNLRPKKTAGTWPLAGASVDQDIGKSMANDDGEGAQMNVPSHENNPASSDLNAGDDKRSYQEPFTTTQSVEHSSDRVVRFKMPADNGVDAVKSVGNTLTNVEINSADEALIREVVNGTQDNPEDESMLYEDEDGAVDEVNSGGGDDDNDNDDGDGDDEDVDHPGEASIGKKLWKFFTT